MVVLFLTAIASKQSILMYIANCLTFPEIRWFQHDVAAMLGARVCKEAAIKRCFLHRDVQDRVETWWTEKPSQLRSKFVYQEEQQNSCHWYMLHLPPTKQQRKVKVEVGMCYRNVTVAVVNVTGWVGWGVWLAGHLRLRWWAVQQIFPALVHLSDESKEFAIVDGCELDFVQSKCSTWRFMATSSSLKFQRQFGCNHCNHLQSYPSCNGLISGFGVPPVCCAAALRFSRQSETAV